MNRLWLNTRDKKRVGRLLGTLLHNHGTDSVSFDDLLKWDLWPCFISIYGTVHSYAIYVCTLMHRLSIHDSLLLSVSSK